VCITRCGNFFGGGDLNFNRIIPGTIRSVLQGRRPVIRSDGTYIRDYIYIRDVLTAYLGLAQKMDDPALHGQAFNFSLENQVTVLELTDIMLALMGRQDLSPIVLDEAGREIRHQYLSAAKARQVLGWKPCYNLEEALSETIEWYRAYFEDAAAEEPAAVV
jgi:CDP-glucose 4,6-dehydratase